MTNKALKTGTTPNCSSSNFRENNLNILCTKNRGIPLKISFANTGKSARNYIFGKEIINGKDYVLFSDRAFKY